MKTFSFQWVLPVLLGVSLGAQAQSTPYVDESLNYSRLQFGGPARTQGIAGANVALGADFGNLSSNPAGLGLFQKSELNFSPGLGLGNADAQGTQSLTGTSLHEQKNSFHIASAGLVLTKRRPDSDQGSNWRGGSFALGFSRVADFNASFSYGGTVNDNQSLFQRLREPGGYASQASSYYQNVINNRETGVLAQYGANMYIDLDGLAYGTYLTDITKSTPDTSRYSVYTRQRNGPITQGETVTTSGSVSQFDLGYGGSYKDKLYIGGAIGIVSSNRRTTRTFTEAENNPATYFTSLSLYDQVRTTSTGVNVRLGLIYRANDLVRFGASIQTPTYFQLTDTYSTSLTTNFSPALPTYDSNNNPINVTTATLTTVPGEYTYALTTPFRANGGLAVTVGKFGFVTGDIEYVGYNHTRLHDDPSDAGGNSNSFSEENAGIANTYQSAINLRFGGEARFDIFRLRVGYAHYGDPYRSGSIDRSQQFYTAGAGLRQGNFFLDVAGVYTSFDQLYSPYELGSQQQPVVIVNNSRYTTTVTAGLTF